uniref:Uncharacterized protein n=1 Tax=Rhizophora mucronata TaxID=61149 RepID=A0A2P2N3A3_RHIMU
MLQLKHPKKQMTSHDIQTALVALRGQSHSNAFIRESSKGIAYADSHSED